MHTNSTSRLTSVLAAVIALLAVWLVHGAQSAVAEGEPAPVFVTPGDDIQALVDANPAGTTFIIGAGVHRLQRITPRDGDAFIGEPGAVLNGATTLSGFSRQGDSWIADAPPRSGTAHGTCVSGYSACQYPEDVFVDGQMLWQVSNLRQMAAPFIAPASAGGGTYLGTWYFESKGGKNKVSKVHLALDPAGRTVQLSVTRDAFNGSALNVTIRGLIIEQYANPAQHGAIHGNGSSGWIVEDNEIRLNHGVGLRTGDGMQVLDNYVHHNGQLGMGGSGDNVLIEGNTIADNNIAGFLIGWEAGGTKFVKTRNLVVRNNYVHDNHGPGLWTDIDNIDSLIEGNRVEWNSYAGIKHEISYAAVIRNNIAGYNGLGKDAWLWGAQIQVQNSSDVEIYGNTVTVGLDGGDGIGVINQSRGSGAYGPYVSVNIYVHDNEVTHFANVGQSGVVDDTSEKLACSAAGNNRFDRNVYNVPSASTYRWTWCPSLNWAGFQAAGQEANGTVHEVTVVSGSIAGTVTTMADGTAIAGATVDVDTGQSATTAADGTYTIANVPIGNHSVTASAAGFGSLTAMATVIEDATATVDLSLTAAPVPIAVQVALPSAEGGYVTSGGRNSDKHLLITVALVDDLGGAVANAAVTVNVLLEGAPAETGMTGTTGADGAVTFSLKNAAPGCYTTTVIDVAADGLTWDGGTPANEFCK